MIVVCGQESGPIVEFLVHEGQTGVPSCFWTKFHDVELDHPTPFYAQNQSVIWLGEPAPDSVSLEFLDAAIAREKAGDLRGCLGIIYQRVDEMVRFGLIELLDEQLAGIRAEEVSSDALLGLLTATLPVKSKLPSRRALFKATKKLLKSRGHYESGVLDGLR